MIRIFVLIFTFIITQVFIPYAFADQSASQTYTITLPGSITVEGIGIVPESQTSGVPSSTESVSFSRLVAGTYNGTTWELTTNKPVGISVSYDKSGYIMATFDHLTREDGYIIPDVKIHPAKVIFGSESSAENRIFKFHPIVTVTRNTQPGTYHGKITFTVIEL